MVFVRVDGLPKVRGEKVYARDFRSKDMPGWGDRMRHALLVRAGRAGHVLQGVDPSRFPPELRPWKLVVAEDLASAHIKQGDGKKFFGSYWLTPAGRAPEHAGQPVAIALFDDLDALRDAAAWMAGGQSPVVFGAPLSPPAENDVRRLVDPLLAMVEREQLPQPYGSMSYVRLAGSPEDEFSFIKNGFHDPLRVAANDKNLKPAALAVNRLARDTWQRIERAIADEGWTVLDRTFFTPTHDPMFMEPEAGIARWDDAEKTLEVVVGTQSPSKDRENLGALLKGSAFAGATGKVKLYPRPPGGGFGGRDSSGFPIYLALSALFSDLPVRLAYDRFEQFLSGIKRHAAVVQNRLAYNDEGVIQALVSTITMDGGGEMNLTNAVVGLAALHAAGPYRVSRTVINSFGVRTTGAPAGSMRGFGVPQVTLAIDCMIDEIAGRLGRDPIAYRLAHLLEQNERDVTGMTLSHHLVNRQIAEAALVEPLWVEREAQKRQRDRAESIAYGVGFAMCMQAYGTTTDAALAEVSLSPDGRLTVYSSAVDMGQGAATAIALATREVLGRPAEQAELAEDERFDALGLSTNDPQSGLYSPKRVNAMSASMTAFHKVHAVREASQVLWDHAIAPAAMALTGAAEVQPIWEDGALRVGDLRLTLSALAAEAHARNLVTSAMVHTYYQQSFASAEFPISGVAVRRHVDALAVRYGASAAYERIPRKDVVFPSRDVQLFRRTLYASAGHLIAVEVHLRSGIIRVTDAVTILDAGKVHHAPLLEGQVEGGLAMGIGMALLEEMPPAPEGTDGSWNLHRYQVVRARHMPLASMKLKLIDFPDDASILSEGPSMQKKGVAEAVITTVPPAIVNAVAHAIGLRNNRVPLTPPRILEALSQK
jgi:CO/xanthine dehydrogenase Mo-binding subunit